MKKYLYIDRETKVAQAVSVINVSPPNMVRVQGNISLNSADKNYPDKLWIDADCLYQQVTVDKEFIDKYKLG